ncbi:MAG: ATP-binding protein [Cytophagaceae bacterium]
MKIGVEDKGKFFQICVTDNGPGINSEKLGSIFKLFEVSHKNQKINSHGIGLSIVKNIIEENGGKIWVESIPEEETKFFFTIPKE